MLSSVSVVVWRIGIGREIRELFMFSYRRLIVPAIINPIGVVLNLCISVRFESHLKRISCSILCFVRSSLGFCHTKQGIHTIRH